MDKKQIINDIKNVKAIPANLLSLSRLGAPIVVPALAFSGNIIPALVAGTCFVTTDFLDGKVARAMHGETKLGEKLDPVCDKLCSIGLMIQIIPSMPVLAIPLILESSIAVINTKSFVNDGNPTTKKSGKIKMWPLYASFVTAYASAATCGIGSLSTAFSTATMGLTLITSSLEIKNIVEYKKQADNNKTNATEEIEVVYENEKVEKEIIYEPRFTTDFSKQKVYKKTR